MPGDRNGRDIALVLAYAENFTPGRAGAFSLFVHETNAYSRFAGGTRVYGKPQEAPFDGAPFVGVAPGMAFSLSRNIRYTQGVIRALRAHPPALIEVFNRPQVFLPIAKALPGVPMVLHLGNDPLLMKHGRSLRTRQAILNRAAGVWCCSRYICNRFLDGLEDSRGVVRPLYSGAERPAVAPEKEPVILFVGRLIDEKGVRELAGALARLLPSRPGWQVHFAGAGRGGAQTPYQAEVMRLLEPLGGQAVFHGHIPFAQVQALMARAAIVAVPSKWDEPMGRVAIEGLAAGAAVVAGRRGGLPELVEGRGVLLDEVSEAALAEALAPLMDDPARLAALHARARADFPFAMRDFVARYDDWREEAMDGCLVGSTPS